MIELDTIDKKKVVKILYVNWRGKEGVRKIVPEEIYFGATKWHPEEQWLLRAFDIQKDAMRDFAMKDIKSWLVL